MADDETLFLDMLTAARRIRTLTAGMSEPDFLADQTIQESVLWNQHIIGEAAGRVSVARRQAEAAIPWRQIRATRNRLVHGYFSINFKTVWQLVEIYVPALVSALEALVPPE
ncbi:MAG: DUF86 domain-containing protein [Chloroflexi bacterium]|nr:DUF86 domain-containing protein [Chloroflexota bacterium]